MNDDITLNPERTNSSSRQLQRDELTLERTVDTQTQQAMQMHSAQGIQCPHCGTINEPAFWESSFIAAMISWSVDIP